MQPHVYVALGIAALLLAPATAVAQYGGGEAQGSTGETAEKEEKPKRRWGSDKKDKGWGKSKQQIDERTGKRLIEAREFLLAEQYDEAEQALSKLRMRSLNPLEKAQAYRVYAFIAYGREDYDQARDYLEKTIAEGVLSPADAADVRFQIAQLYLSEENWAEAAANLEQWFEVVQEPNSAAYYLLALTYYQLDRLEDAIVPAQKSVDISDLPRENWLQLLLALRLTRKEYAEAVPVIEALVERFPKKAYYLNLSTVHGAMENYEEALVPLQLAYAQDLLDEDAELRRLAQLMLFLDLPFRAAKVMASGLEGGVILGDSRAWAMLSNSWIAAREYDLAVDPLVRAAEKSTDGDLFVRLAQVHIQREKWSEAADALRRALDKGGLDNPGDAQLLMGIAFYSQKQPQQARSWFSRAREHAVTRAEAETWIQHIDRENPSAESSSG